MPPYGPTGWRPPASGFSYVVHDPMKVLRPVQRSLGCFLVGAAPLQPDPDDIDNKITGIMKRLVRDFPAADRATLRRLRSFTRVFVRRHFEPLDDRNDLSFEHWLDKTSYPNNRKEELRRACRQLEDEGMLPKHYGVKYFIKRETYNTFKYARGINSRSDRFKVLTGPFFHAVEEVVFQSKFFIKYIPVAERSRWLWQRLGSIGKTYCGTDHTNFELHIAPEIMRAVEFQLYSWMASRIPELRSVVGHISTALSGVQRCHNRGISFTGHFRCSGDMCTSLGNGITNLVVMAFLSREAGWPDFDAVVEGDDAVFPELGRPLTQADFGSVGFDVKVTRCSSLGVIGFCHLHFVEGEFDNIVDPAKTILLGGWTGSSLMWGGERVRAGLARARALSVLCQAPGCPVVASYARWILRSTDGVPVPKAVFEPSRWWTEEIMRDSSVEASLGRSLLGPTDAARAFVAEHFALPICEQLRLEAMFEGLNHLRPIDDFGLLNWLVQDRRGDLGVSFQDCVYAWSDLVAF